MSCLFPRRQVMTCGQARMATRGSRKHLMASLDQSLKRMNLDYVDVFYSHRYDPENAVGRNSSGIG